MIKYKELVKQIKEDIILHRSGYTSTLPSIRVFAQRMQINANTAAKVYKQLKNEGYIVNDSKTSWSNVI